MHVAVHNFRLTNVQIMDFSRARRLSVFSGPVSPLHVPSHVTELFLTHWRYINYVIIITRES